MSAHSDSLSAEKEFVGRSETYYYFIHALLFWCFAPKQKLEIYLHLQYGSSPYLFQPQGFQDILRLSSSHAVDLLSSKEPARTAAIQAAGPPTVLVEPSIKARATFILPPSRQLTAARQHQTWC